MTPKPHPWNRSLQLHLTLSRQREAARRRRNSSRAAEDYKDPVYRAAILERRRRSRAKAQAKESTRD